MTNLWIGNWLTCGLGAYIKNLWCFWSWTCDMLFPSARVFSQVQAMAAMAEDQQVEWDLQVQKTFIHVRQRSSDSSDSSERSESSPPQLWSCPDCRKRRHCRRHCKKCTAGWDFEQIGVFFFSNSKLFCLLLKDLAKKNGVIDTLVNTPQFSKFDTRWGLLQPSPVSFRQRWVWANAVWVALEGSLHASPAMQLLSLHQCPLRFSTNGRTEVGKCPFNVVQHNPASSKRVSTCITIKWACHPPQDFGTTREKELLLIWQLKTWWVLQSRYTGTKPLEVRFFSFFFLDPTQYGSYFSCFFQRFWVSWGRSAAFRCPCRPRSQNPLRPTWPLKGPRCAAEGRHGACCELQQLLNSRILLITNYNVDTPVTQKPQK